MPYAGQVAVDPRNQADVVECIILELARRSEPPTVPCGFFYERATMKRSKILAKAEQAVTVDRAATHGDVENNFEILAAIWSVRLGVSITPAQATIMLIDLKTVRAWGNSTHADNWIDMAGYAACGGDMADSA